jgi:hypothetical protein
MARELHVARRCGAWRNGSLAVRSIDDDAIIGSLAAADAFDFDPTGPFTAVLCR